MGGRRTQAKAADAHSGTPGLVLDAGALQALERHHLRLLLDLRRAHQLGLPIRIPAGSLAQSWRGGPRSAALARRLLKQPCTIVEMNERAARQLGEFIALLHGNQREKPDIVDAHGALIARLTRSLLWTSDPADMERYQVPAVLIRKV